MVSIAFPGAITSFDLVVNRAAKLTESRASGDHMMAVATFRYALRGSYRDCSQYKKNQNKRTHTMKPFKAALEPVYSISVLNRRKKF